ncbi:MAG: tRNA lysidine(34) synthetase TilS [Thermoanaerobaculia bacterium]|nr:tRNA lysidine(34) synthetase TilS [Thermoanaerobaculia bacterium]
MRLHAAHFDHRLDPDSERRAHAAAQTARWLGVDFSLERWSQSGGDLAGASVEARARHARYEFLERTATRLDARWIATAHHADDQAETVLLRLLFGSGLHGLAGIQPVRGRVVRPVLDLARPVLRASIEAFGPEPSIQPVEDPTNLDLARPRNRIRHVLLPALERTDGDLRDRLCRLASAARDANTRIEGVLGSCLATRREPDGGVAADRQVLERLPEVLIEAALASIQRIAGGSFPPPATVRAELLRQLRGPGRVGCDSVEGWRWEADATALRLTRRQAGTGILTDLFTYTLSVPGEVVLPELRLRLELRRDHVADWMFRGWRSRVGLAPISDRKVTSWCATAVPATASGRWGARGGGSKTC